MFLLLLMCVWKIHCCSNTGAHKSTLVLYNCFFLDIWITYHLIHFADCFICAKLVFGKTFFFSTHMTLYRLFVNIIRIFYDILQGKSQRLITEKCKTSHWTIGSNLQSKTKIRAILFLFRGYQRKFTIEDNWRQMIWEEMRKYSIYRYWSSWKCRRAMTANKTANDFIFRFSSAVCLEPYINESALIDNLIDSPEGEFVLNEVETECRLSTSRPYDTIFSIFLSNIQHSDDIFFSIEWPSKLTGFLYQLTCFFFAMLSV